MLVAIEEEPGLHAEEFLALANRVRPRDYDAQRCASALQLSLNIGARANGNLFGCIRVLTVGYFFGTIPEMLVDPHSGATWLRPRAP